VAKNATHTVGLDVGTSRITCIIGEPGEGGHVEVVGIGESEAKGLRKGVVVDPEAAVEAITRAVEEAERMSGLEAEEVAINLSGSHIMSFNGQAIVAVSGRERDPVYESGHGRRNAHAPVIVAGRDREITQDDVRRAVESASAVQLPAGREIVDRLPQEFIVDDQDGINDPVGMIGSHFTNDIAFGLRTPIPEADKIKRNAGCACGLSLSEAERSELVEVPSVGGRPPRQLSRQILCDILQPRAEEVLSHVADEIREAGWEGQLSSGVVLTGGGSLLGGMVEIAEQVFDAPVRLGYPERARFRGLVEDVQSPAWAAASGLCLLAQRAKSAEMRASAARAQGAGGFGALVSKFRNRFGGIF